MKVYNRSSNRSDIQSEVRLVLPRDPRAVRFDGWFESLTTAQKRFVHGEHKDIDGPTYGPDPEDAQVPDLK